MKKLHKGVQVVAECINPVGIACECLVLMFLGLNLCFWPLWVHFPAGGLCLREALGALAVITALSPRFSMKRFVFMVSVAPAAFHCGGASVNTANWTI